MTEREIEQAIIALIDAEQTLAEASGAAALAAVLSGKTPAAETTVVVISGGNTDSRTLRPILTAAGGGMAPDAEGPGPPRS